jgi:DnaJ-class molecular chaperone
MDTKYVDCPECGGQGKQMRAENWGTGHQEVWHLCEFCEGEGKFEEEDYLVMRLEGKV